jgi:hypothetical protein
LWYANQNSKWRDTALRRSYKKARLDVKRATRLSIREHELSLANDKYNPKRLYAYVNRKKPITDSISCLKNKDDVLCTDGESIAQLLNKQFESVFSTEPHDDVMPTFLRRTSESLVSVQFDTATIQSYLDGLDPNKTMGGDMVNPFVLKQCSASLAKPLEIIFRASLEQSVIPNEWSQANVTPLFKKGIRTDPSNYRPISLTSIPCKVMERLIRDQIARFVVRNKLLSPSQHGFVKGRACVTNLLETVDYLTDEMSKKNSVDIIFLDFAKAFDTVAHKRLLHKLNAYGISGPLLNWIRAFLANRKQRVVLGESKSSWSAVTSGVPQGSVLGPILFTLFINDLPECVENSICKLYADDSKIMRRVGCKAEHDLLQQDINRISAWTQTWRLFLNVGKCKVMHVNANGHTPHRYSMGGVDASGNSTQIYLEQTSEERDLGIQLAVNLKFTVQSINAASKANRVLGMLKRSFVSRNTELWKRLYTTYVRPHLEYAVAAWNPYLKKDVEALEKIQRRATRVPSKLRAMDYEQRCKAMGLTSLVQRRTRGDLIQQFKIANNLDIVEWHSLLLSVQTKDGHVKLHREKHRNCNQRFSFFNNRIVNCWNELPNYVIRAESTNDFKNRYDAWVAQGAVKRRRSRRSHWGAVRPSPDGLRAESP